jgi:hypothetical protein
LLRALLRLEFFKARLHLLHHLLLGLHLCLDLLKLRLQFVRLGGLRHGRWTESSHAAQDQRCAH